MKIKTKVIIEFDLEESIDIKHNLGNVLNHGIDDATELSNLEEFDTKLYNEIEKIRDKCNGYLG